jgi:uncharacterized membrane protein
MQTWKLWSQSEMKAKQIALSTIALLVATPCLGFIGDRPPGDPPPVSTPVSEADQQALTGVVPPQSMAPTNRVERIQLRQDNVSEKPEAKAAVRSSVVTDPKASAILAQAHEEAQGGLLPPWLGPLFGVLAGLGALIVGFRWYADKHAPKMPVIKPSAIERR